MVEQRRDRARGGEGHPPHARAEGGLGGSRDWLGGRGAVRSLRRAGLRAGEQRRDRERDGEGAGIGSDSGGGGGGGAPLQRAGGVQRSSAETGRGQGGSRDTLRGRGGW